LKSRLSKIESQTFKNCKADSQKLKESNTGNNTSTNTSKKRERKTFVPPSLEEVQKYCQERKNNVDAKKFFDYFTASDWVDGKGNPVRNWKQKIITWESYGRNEANGNNDKASGDTKKQRVGHYL
jgi:hypothetical protein